MLNAFFDKGIHFWLIFIWCRNFLYCYLAFW